MIYFNFLYIKMLPTKLPTASPVAERVASGPPKPALADFVEIALRRQQTV